MTKAVFMSSNLKTLLQIKTKTIVYEFCLLSQFIKTVNSVLRRKKDHSLTCL